MKEITPTQVAEKLIHAKGPDHADEFSTLADNLCKDQILKLEVTKRLLDFLEHESFRIRVRTITVLMILGLWKLDFVYQKLFDIFNKEFTSENLEEIAEKERKKVTWESGYSEKEVLLCSLLYAVMSTELDPGYELSRKVYPVFLDTPLGAKIKKWNEEFYPKKPRL